MYDLLEKKILTSRDVIFYKSIFLFANTSLVSPSSQSPILPYIVDTGDEPILSITLSDLPSSSTQPSSTPNQNSSEITSLDIAPKCSTRI